MRFVSNDKSWVYGGTGMRRYRILKTEIIEERWYAKLECERLQGLPDNWTEGGSDSKRYKAIGNGMAQPCADFVIEKLVEALKERG